MKRTFTFLFTLLLAVAGVRAEVAADLVGKYFSAAEATATLQTDTWYLLKNQGRSAYISEENDALKMKSTGSVPKYAEAEANAGLLFKFAAGANEGQYSIVSGNGNYLTFGSSSSAVSASAVDYIIGSIAEGYWYMQDPTSNIVADGNAAGGTFVGWGTSVPTGTNGNNAYQFLEVSFFDEAVMTTLNKAAGMAYDLQVASGLVTDASKFSSNAKEPSEGSFGALIDGEYTSFFHSAYSVSVDGAHYLQAEVNEPVKDFFFYFKKRSHNNNNRPTDVTVLGSNDGQEFKEITTINTGFPTDAADLDYASAVINASEAYKHFRFVVNQTNSGSVFFTFSEFYLLPADKVEALAAAQALVAAGPTAENFDELAAEFETICNKIQAEKFAKLYAEAVTKAEAILASAVYKDAPALGEYSTVGYNTCKAAIDELKLEATQENLDAINAAIAAFEATKNLPVFTINSLKDYALGQSIYENTDGSLKFKTTDAADPSMLWTFDITTTEVGLTDKVVVRNVATGNLFWNASYLTVIETEPAVEGDGVFMFKTEGTGAPVHAQQSGSAIVRWSSADANTVGGASTWTFTCVGTTYSIYDLNETIEGEWTDITNNGDIVNPDLSSLEAYGQVYWNATNHTSYDAANGVMEFVAGENTAASLIQNEVPFAKGAYRLTGKAYHKGAVNAVMFVGANEVAIPEAEDFVEFTIEFTAEGAQWGMDYFNIGYSCEFDNAEDVLVVGGLKLEEKKSTTLRALFEEKAMALEMLGYNIGQFATLHAEQQKVMTETVMPLFEAIRGGQKVLKSEVEKAVEAIDTVMAKVNPVADFYKGDFMDALFAAEELKWEFDEESEEYALLDAAINEANNVAEVTTVAELEAKLVAFEETLAPLYNLDETIEGEWEDVTNKPNEYGWTIIDHAELLGLGEYWVPTNNTNYDAERGVMEFVAGEDTTASLIQEYCPFGQATYRLTGKAFHKGATNAVLFVGDQTVEIPAAAEGATFENAEEHFTTFSIEFTCEAAWGTQLTIGYSCEFDSADDFLVVGGLKLEEKKSTTLRGLFEETIMACESLGWEIMQMSALHAQQQAVMATAMPIYEALMGNQKVLKAEVEQSIAEMEAVIAELSPVAEYYKGDFSDALWAAEELKWEFDEESEEYADLDAAINEANDVAEVTTVAELEAKLEALKVVVELIETGIENVEAETETVIYDLNGRRVTEMTKGGIYIVNGKKVVIK